MDNNKETSLVFTRKTSGLVKGLSWKDIFILVDGSGILFRVNRIILNRAIKYDKVVNYIDENKRLFYVIT